MGSSVVTDGVARYLDALHEMAEVAIDSSKPIRLYVRSAESVFKQACIYRSENDLEKAFILFLKYSNLVLKELPRHPEYAANSRLTAPLRGNLLVALDVLEATKPILLERYQQVEVERASLAQREREFAAARKREDEARLLAQRTAKSQEEARRQRLVEMQKLDIKRAYANNTLLDRSISGDIAAASSSGDKLDGTSNVMPSSPTSLAPVSGSTVPLTATTVPSASAPALITTHSLVSPTHPSLQAGMASKTTSSLSSGHAAIPSPKALYYLENGMPLRSITIPAEIITKFLRLAAENTKKNLEFCGVLTGILAHDAFTLTTLVIPKQTSTSDTVSMEGEEEVHAVQESRNLLTLGWIHTHPTQQCFMSSVDLHTQLPYQYLLEESIAIVVAPTQSPNYGIFRLTNPPGLDIIGKCSQRGFHPHPSERPIYKEISGPEGHAKFSSSHTLEVIDLR